MREAIVPYTVSGLDDRDILARAAVAPDSLLASVRREIWAVGSNVAAAETGSLQTLLKESSFTEPQFDLIATGAFAGIGLALVVIGLISVTAYKLSHPVEQQARVIAGRFKMPVVCAVLLLAIYRDLGKELILRSEPHKHWH